MASLKEIKSRIVSVSSTRKITAAMKMVASAKLAKAQQLVEHSASYTKMLNQLFADFLANCEDLPSCYMEVRPVKRVAIVAFASNSSLCGGYNENVIKHLYHLADQYKVLGAVPEFYPVGRKIADAVRKAGFQSDERFVRIGDNPAYGETSALVALLMRRYFDQEIDKADVLYTCPQSMSRQVVENETYLPFQLPSNESSYTSEYIVEPSSAEVAARLFPEVLYMRMYSALLASNASEYATRTMAMQVATDNANDLIQDLTVLYNTSRQQIITGELLDIMGGAIR